jgi:uncharacterized protein with FMN-binding domain
MFVLYAAHDERFEHDKKTRTFFAAITGESIPKPESDGVYIGTAMTDNGSFVLHLFAAV